MDYKQRIKENTEDFVQKELKLAESGHDWWHAQRVRNTALKISEIEGGDRFIIEIASLLHDIADAKFNNGNEKIGSEKAFNLLESNHLDTKYIHSIIDIINNISFRKNNFPEQINTIEFKIVQDADRLDALGAIGIARAFSYGGYKKRLFYDPNISVLNNISSEQYKNSESPTINHFYEKLLLLKDKMNTETAKNIAIKRHNFMKEFLDQFYLEWNCNL